MARKPNYKWERMERDRAKAAKKAARLEAKKEKAEGKSPAETGLDSPDENFAKTSDEMPPLPPKNSDSIQ